MPVAAETTRFAISIETTYNVKSTGVYYVLPITNDGVSGDADSEFSQTLNANRQLSDSILNSIDSGGNLDMEFARSEAMDVLFRSCFGNDFTFTAGELAMKVANQQISFTLEKRFEDPVNDGQYLYHYYPGCVVNTMTINAPAGQTVTCSVGILGGTLSTGTADLGTGYADVSITALRGPDVNNIVIDNAGNTLASTITCITDLSLNFNNNYRGIKCLGTTGNSDVVIGAFEPTYSLSALFKSNLMMDEFIAQSAITSSLVIGVDDGSTTENFYKFTTYDGKLSANVVVAGGQGTDVVNAAGLTWFYDSTALTSILVETRTVP